MHTYLKNGLTLESCQKQMRAIFWGTDLYLLRYTLEHQLVYHGLVYPCRGRIQSGCFVAHCCIRNPLFLFVLSPYVIGSFFYTWSFLDSSTPAPAAVTKRVATVERKEKERDSGRQVLSLFLVSSYLHLERVVRHWHHVPSASVYS